MMLDWGVRSNVCEASERANEILIESERLINVTIVVDHKS